MNAIPTYVRIRIYRTNYGSIIMYLNGGVGKEILLKLIFLSKNIVILFNVKKKQGYLYLSVCWPPAINGCLASTVYLYTKGNQTKLNGSIE